MHAYSLCNESAQVVARCKFSCSIQGVFSHAFKECYSTILMMLPSCNFLARLEFELCS